MHPCAPNQYPVHLTPDERDRLDALTRTGSAPVAKVRHARVLLLSDRGRPDGPWPEARIAAALGLHRNTVARIRKRFVQDGERPALDRTARAAPPRSRRRSTATSRPNGSPCAAARPPPAGPGGPCTSWRRS